MVFNAPVDLFLGPIHELGHSRHDGIDLHRTPMLALLVSWLGHKDHVALVMLFVLIPATMAGIAVGSVSHLIDILRLVPVVHRLWGCTQGLSVCTCKRWWRLR